MRELPGLYNLGQRVETSIIFQALVTIWCDVASLDALRVYTTFLLIYFSCHTTFMLSVFSMRSRMIALNCFLISTGPT